jgi:hypothetical protein
MSMGLGIGLGLDSCGSPPAPPPRPPIVEQFTWYPGFGWFPQNPLPPPAGYRTSWQQQDGNYDGQEIVVEYQPV